MTRLLTLLLSVCGVYPQYRAIRTILTGLGLVSGDSWEQNRKVNMKLGQIEPVAEGMFQLICQCIILYIVNGPGESTDHGREKLLSSAVLKRGSKVGRGSKSIPRSRPLPPLVWKLQPILFIFYLKIFHIFLILFIAPFYSLLHVSRSNRILKFKG